MKISIFFRLSDQNKEEKDSGGQATGPRPVERQCPSLAQGKLRSEIRFGLYYENYTARLSACSKWQYHVVQLVGVKVVVERFKFTC